MVIGYIPVVAYNIISIKLGHIMKTCRQGYNSRTSQRNLIIVKDKDR